MAKFKTPEFNPVRGELVDLSIRTWIDTEVIPALDEYINAGKKDARCPCGGVILADTEDWNIPLCADCYTPNPRYWIDLTSEGVTQIYGNIGASPYKHGRVVCRDG